jgi:hypothetical protein
MFLTSVLCNAAKMPSAYSKPAAQAMKGLADLADSGS